MMLRSFGLVLGLVVGGVGCAAESDPLRAGLWSTDSLQKIGGAEVTVVGEPRVATVGNRTALVFDGVNDGCVVAANPLEGLAEFTIQILFFPDAAGPTEQRFFHTQDVNGRRLLFELRLDETGRKWCLDTFLFSPQGRLTLIDRTKWHPVERWHWAAITFREGTMTHYVNGVSQGGGTVVFDRMGAGETSLGMRMNRVHWFKGAIAEVRATGRALRDNELERLAK